jgi:hypothetical protein
MKRLQPYSEAATELAPQRSMLTWRSDFQANGWKKHK